MLHDSLHRLGAGEAAGHDEPTRYSSMMKAEVRDKTLGAAGVAVEEEAW